MSVRQVFQRAALIVAIGALFVPDALAQRGEGRSGRGPGGGPGPSMQRSGPPVGAPQFRGQPGNVNPGRNAAPPRDWNRPNSDYYRRYIDPSPGRQQSYYRGQPGYDRSRGPVDRRSDWERGYSSRPNAPGNWRSWYYSPYTRYGAGYGYGRGYSGYYNRGPGGAYYNRGYSNYYGNRGYYNRPYGAWGGYGYYRGNNGRYGYLPFAIGALTGVWPYNSWAYGGYPGFGYGGYRYNYGTPYMPGRAYYSSAPAVVQQAPTTSAADYATRGEQLFRAGRYEESIQALQHALVDDPLNYGLIDLMAQALFAVGRYEDAAGALQFVMNAVPEAQWGGVVKNYRQIYGNIGDYTAQLKRLEASAKEQPDDPSRQFLLGYHYGFLGYPEQAVKKLDNLIAQNEQDELGKQLRNHFSPKSDNTSTARQPAETTTE